jgi:acyl carrier protein
MDQKKVAINTKIKAYIRESAYGDELSIQDGTLIFKDGYFDSMGFVMLISFLSENFGISVIDSELIEENFESINAITDFIVRKIS